MLLEGLQVHQTRKLFFKGTFVGEEGRGWEEGKGEDKG